MCRIKGCEGIISFLGNNTYMGDIPKKEISHIYHGRKEYMLANKSMHLTKIVLIPYTL